MDKPMMRAWAFTLVELLIVIALISLLIALGLPTMRSAILSARRTACLSNLRQVGTVVTEYALRNPRNPNRMFAIDSGDWRENVLFYMMGATNRLAIETNRQTVAIFRCPESPAGVLPTTYSFSGHPDLLKLGARKRFTDVSRISEVVLAADATHPSETTAADEFLQGVSGGDLPTTSPMEPSNAAFRHPGAGLMGAGTVYVDAHAALVGKGRYTQKNFSLK